VNERVARKVAFDKMWGNRYKYDVRVIKVWKNKFKVRYYGYRMWNVGITWMAIDRSLAPK